MRCCSQFIAPLDAVDAAVAESCNVLCCALLSSSSSRPCLFGCFEDDDVVDDAPSSSSCRLKPARKAGQPVFEAEEQNRNQIRRALELRNEVDVLCGCADLCSSA